MYKDLINIPDNKINGTSTKSTEAISNREFYEKKQTDCNSWKTINKETRDVKLHYAVDYIDKGDCNLGLHRVFLFIDDESHQYANDAENGVYFKCACLDCGRIDTYRMSQLDRRQTIYTQTNNSIEEFYKIRDRFLKLKNNNIEVEQITKIINSEYEKNKNKQLVKKQ